MSRIEIDAGGRHIIVEHDGELAHLADQARELWDHTHTADQPPPGGAVGFTTAQRGSRPPAGTMPYGPSRIDTHHNHPTS